MEKVIEGVVRGRTVELAVDPGIEDGRQVQVILRIKELPAAPPGWKPESSETAAGMMADYWTEEDDRILEDIYQDRKRT